MLLHFYHSVFFEDKVGAYLSETLKETPLYGADMADGNKHSNLLRCGTNYGLEKFYNGGPLDTIMSVLLFKRKNLTGAVVKKAFFSFGKKARLFAKGWPTHTKGGFKLAKTRLNMLARSKHWGSF